MDTIVENLFKQNGLPVFQIAGHCISVEDGDKIYDFKVFNQGEVPGIITLSGNDPGWVIPPGEGRNIRKYVKMLPILM